MPEPVSFDEASARRIAAAVRRVERMRDNHAQRSHRKNIYRPSPRTLVRVTAHAVLRSINITVGGGASVSVEVAWTYGATEARPVIATALSADVTGARVWSETGASGNPKLYNLAEFNHTASAVWGIDPSTANYPAGNRPRPVGGAGTTNTHKYDRLVEVWQTTDSLGNAVWVMDEVGSHDGSCT